MSGTRRLPHYKWYIVNNHKMRTESFDADNKIDEVEVVNEKQGWVKDGNKPTEALSKEQMDSRRENLYTNWVATLAPLKAKEFHLTLLDEISVAGKKAIGIQVSCDGHDPIKLYFDRATYLLVKCQRNCKYPEVGKEVSEDDVYSYYRNVQDTMQPFKTETYWDGVKVMELTASEIKLYENRPDDKLFSKP